jgi:anti-sigma regulatory factor (Ser/Thr protein kinase)
MSKVDATIDFLLDAQEAVTAPDVAHHAGVSRQAAHAHLRWRVEAGTLLRVGAGRATRYRRKALMATSWTREGLQEDQVWEKSVEGLSGVDPTLLETHPRLRAVMNYAFTEMVNNAVDHSVGKTVVTRWFLQERSLAFEVEDDGVGVFGKVQTSYGLASEFEAIGQLSKGRQTTAPETHSGMGIFFTSKAVDKLVLTSHHLSWTVDRSRNDEAIGWLENARRGTLVRCEVDLDTTVDLKEVFSAFTDPDTFAFDKSVVRVGLFQRGASFVSRAEAKRLAANLDEFESVEIDFAGVDEVGQGFVDELFRVWARSHPRTRLIPVNANPAVAAMVAGATSDRPVRNA